jgi:hypothetical protein
MIRFIFKSEGGCALCEADSEADGILTQRRTEKESAEGPLNIKSTEEDASREEKKFARADERSRLT